jgi:two-component sensor histidine kinase
MAMVHEVLYRSDNFEGVEMQKYFERLSEYLSGVYEGAYRGIRCSVSAKGLSLDLDSAIPVALIVNELVSNSFKHAFPDMRKGGISISLAEKEKQLELVVCDDGVGFEAAKGAKEPSSAQGGIGSELVQALTAQLHGEIERRSERGARTVIHFPKNV